MASRKRINLTKSSSRSIKSFFSISREKVDGGRSWWWSGKWDENKLLTIFIAHILIVLFALLPKIISSVNDIRNKSYMNCGNEMKMKKWSSRWTQFIQLRKETWKNSGLQWGLNPWPRDTGVMLYQLSYEATDVGCRSIVGSYVPVKEMTVNGIWNKSYMNCGNEMKMKKWSLQRMQFMQLRKEAWKKNIQDFNGVWTRDLAILVRCSTNWALTPLTLGAGQDTRYAGDTWDLGTHLPGSQSLWEFLRSQYWDCYHSMLSWMICLAQLQCKHTILSTYADDTQIF